MCVQYFFKCCVLKSHMKDSLYSIDVALQCIPPDSYSDGFRSHPHTADHTHPKAYSHYNLHRKQTYQDCGGYRDIIKHF